MVAPSAQHNLPISARPRQTWSRTLQAILFFLLFNLGCIMINGSQFAFLLPLRLLPFRWSRKLYYSGIRYTKGSFAVLQSKFQPCCTVTVLNQSVVLMCQWFAPTKLVITFERDGIGKFTDEDLRNYLQKNAKGDIIGLDLPSKVVVIANHQASTHQFHWRT